MKLMDEVKLESSVDALEALCATFQNSPQWPAIRQNLKALREVLGDATDASIPEGIMIPVCDCQDYAHGLVSNECPVHNENPRVPPIPRMSDELRTFIEGMSVSVDVSTGDHDAQHRYFGTVTEVMDDPTDKHGVTLLVQDAKPNFKPPSRAVGYRTERGQFYGSLRAMPSHEHATARKVYDLGVPAVDRSPDGVGVMQDQPHCHQPPMKDTPA